MNLKGDGVQKPRNSTRGGGRRGVSVHKPIRTLKSKHLKYKIEGRIGQILGRNWRFCDILIKMSIKIFMDVPKRKKAEKKR